MIKTVTFNYTGAVQTWTPPIGITRIKIECFGARGGGSMRSGSVNSDGGYGGYCYGEYILNDTSPKQLQIYVGGVGGNAGYSTAPGGWNGGGSGTYDGRDDEGGGGGGGATDVRIIAASPGSWYDTSHASWDTDKSLLSRIIVAGGGGGLSWTFTPGVGGGLIGGTGANTVSLPATQTSGYAFGLGQNGYGDGSDGGGGNDGVGGGGGGWYGGCTINSPSICSGCGGSSYYGTLLNAGTTSGINNGNGKVIITYEDDPNAYFLEKDNKFYVPMAKYFNADTNGFTPITLTDIKNELIEDNSTLNMLSIIKPFTINSITYLPAEIINFCEYKICIMTPNNLYKLSLAYTPSDVALSKTEIKIKNKYTPVSDELEPTFLDITSSDKSKIDYFIDYGQDKIYKNCSILNTDVITNDFYLDFKLDDPDSLLQSVTLFGKNNDKYTKIKDFEINVYEDFDNKESSNTFISFTNDYDEVTINRIYKEDLIYTINTLDKF